MLSVLSAEGAILIALKFFRSILLVLDGIVVSLLALFTSQSDFDSVVSHTFGTSYFIYPRLSVRISASLYETGNSFFHAKMRAKINLSSDR